MENNSYRWFIAGAMLGAASAYMGKSMISGNKRVARKARSKAASAVGHLSREAGEMLGMMGETWANRMR